MKYVVILGDGMADLPLEQLGNKTPLQAANKPNMDYIASHGECGLVKTVPDKMSPGSDIANLAVLGYNPQLYYSGRSPLEAVSMGVEMADTDVAIRCNLVSLSEEEPVYTNKTMVDYSSDEITTEEAVELMAVVARELPPLAEGARITFHPGISYRHCMIWHHGKTALELTPPHNISGKRIESFVPKSPEVSFVLALMEKSYEILKDHPVNQSRRERGLRAANSIWLWGEGSKPRLPDYRKMFGVTGAMISAVDLLNGIALCGGLKVIPVEGATGNIHTNFRGKAMAAFRELESGSDFVYVHLEAPDECGHRGEMENKVLSIERIDEEVLGVLLQKMEIFSDYRILLLPDHPTPLSIRTHTSAPVPYVLYRKNGEKNGLVETYDEYSAEQTGFFEENGYLLIQKLFADK